MARVALAALGWIWWPAWARLVAGDAVALCVASVALGDSTFASRGIALGDIYLRFAWQTWHLRHWAGSGGRVASVALVDIYLRFAWQAWHLWHWAGFGGRTNASPTDGLSSDGLQARMAGFIY